MERCGAPYGPLDLRCVYTGELFPGVPRSLLIRTLEKAAEMGFAYRVGPEIEFYLFKADEKGLPISNGTLDGAAYSSSLADGTAWI